MPDQDLSEADQRSLDVLRRLLTCDPSAVAPVSQAELLQATSRAMARLDGARLALVDAYSESLDWAAQGSRSAASWLVGHTEVSHATAAAEVRTARKLRSMPATARASATGDLGAAKVMALAATRRPEVAELFDGHEAELVDTVRSLTVDGARSYLRAWLLRAKAEAGCDDGDADHLADHLHVSATFAGHHAISGGYCATDGAILTGALDTEIDTWFRHGVLQGDQRNRSELRAAALIALVERAAAGTTSHGAARPTVIALVDADTLAGRTPDQQSMTLVTEVLGGGPVAVETLRRLLCEGDICRVVHNGRSMPLDVGRTHRLATADQWRALLAVSGGHCEWPGCDTPADWSHVHHLRPWEANGDTDIDNLGLACTRHHHALHEGRYTMARTPHGVQVTDRHGIRVHPPPYVARPAA